MKTRKCARTELSLETNYLPLKLFVCRCSTDPNSTLVSVHTAEPCDVKIAKSISQIEEDAAKQNVSKSVLFDAALVDRKLIVSRQPGIILSNGKEMGMQLSG